MKHLMTTTLSGNTQNFSLEFFAPEKQVATQKRKKSHNFQWDFKFSIAFYVTEWHIA